MPDYGIYTILTVKSEVFESGISAIVCINFVNYVCIVD